MCQVGSAIPSTIPSTIPRALQRRGNANALWMRLAGLIALLALLFSPPARAAEHYDLLPGTFCAGEMLDWEAPTGGYLLTACFASGRAAGLGALAWLRSAASEQS